MVRRIIIIWHKSAPPFILLLHQSWFTNIVSERDYHDFLNTMEQTSSTLISNSSLLGD